MNDSLNSVGDSDDYDPADPTNSLSTSSTVSSTQLSQPKSPVSSSPKVQNPVISGLQSNKMIAKVPNPLKGQSSSIQPSDPTMKNPSEQKDSSTRPPSSVSMQPPTQQSPQYVNPVSSNQQNSLNQPPSNLSSFSAGQFDQSNVVNQSADDLFTEYLMDFHVFIHELALQGDPRAIYVESVWKKEFNIDKLNPLSTEQIRQLQSQNKFVFSDNITSLLWQDSQEQDQSRLLIGKLQLNTSDVGLIYQVINDHRLGKKRIHLLHLEILYDEYQRSRIVQKQPT